MNKIDAMIAPRALTSEELASVIAPQMVVYGLAHRALIHARCLQDGEADGATRQAAESMLESVVGDARASMADWLGDMQAEGDPRFFQKAGLERAISDLLGEAAQAFCRHPDEGDTQRLVADIECRQGGWKTIVANANKD